MLGLEHRRCGAASDDDTQENLAYCATLLRAAQTRSMLHSALTNGDISTHTIGMAPSRMHIACSLALSGMLRISRGAK
jgi:hypothetical protein